MEGHELDSSGLGLGQVVGFCQHGNESWCIIKEYNPSLPSAVDNERRILPASMSVTCCDVSVLQIVYIGYVRMCRKGNWMKRLMFVIRPLTAVLQTYLIHMKCYINISHIPIPSFTCYCRRYTQHIAYVRRHSISAHHLYNQYCQPILLISLKMFVFKLSDLIILTLYNIILHLKWLFHE